MKISWKIFIISYCLMILALGVNSFFPLVKNYVSARENVYEQAKTDNQYLYSYAVTLDKLSSNEDIKKPVKALADSFADENKKIIIGYKSELSASGDNSILSLKENSIAIEKKNINGKSFIQAASRIKDLYIVCQYSLEPSMNDRDEELIGYKRNVIVISVLMSVILFLFAAYIARPLKYVKDMAEIISSGDYSARINTDMRAMKSQEVKFLGETMNKMAESTQKNINELEDMLKKREIFMGDFSHEIKTPLTSIIGYGDLLRTYELDKDKIREYGDFIYKEGKRLENLSQILLQLIVMDNSRLEFERIGIKTLFRQIEKSAEGLGDKYGVNISFHMEDAGIKAESSLFITAIMNFIDNACKASKVGGKVSVTGELSGEDYIISVKDEGKGIAKDELDKIMEPFYMTDKSRARSQGGAGLGLALCKRIAELHEAKLKINSVINEGTTVTLTVRRTYV